MRATYSYEQKETAAESRLDGALFVGADGSAVDMIVPGESYRVLAGVSGDQGATIQGWVYTYGMDGQPQEGIPGSLPSSVPVTLERQSADPKSSLYDSYAMPTGESIRFLNVAVPPGPGETQVYADPGYAKAFVNGTANQAAIDRLAQRCNQTIHSLEDALTCMTAVVEGWKKTPKVVGIKSAHAYGRSLQFKKTPHHEAEILFNKILTHEGRHLSAHEALPLQDYLMYQLAARAEAVGLPMVFHTGLQAGNFNRIANAHPLLLQEFIEEFPRLKIDLFHAGMPWVREIGVLAKYFPQVHLNMAWTHIINPAQARSALSEWLDMAPNTKIFGFGGDYGIVEKVYGHLKLARLNVATVLAAKIREGAYRRDDASLVARRLMSENAAKFYGLA